MQEVFKKIISNLKEQKSGLTEWSEDKAFEIGIEKSIEIVKQVAAEYNNGWIPCDVLMPEEHDSMFAKLKGSDKWNSCMFERASDMVNVTVADENGNEVSTTAHTIDGKWSCDFLRINKSFSVIAWRPFPEPYRKTTVSMDAMRDNDPDKKMTNVDRIRAMSDEKLAEFLSEVKGDGIYYKDGMKYPVIQKVWEYWLQSEVED